MLRRSSGPARARTTNSSRPTLSGRQRFLRSGKSLAQLDQYEGYRPVGASALKLRPELETHYWRLGPTRSLARSSSHGGNLGGRRGIGDPRSRPPGSRWLARHHGQSHLVRTSWVRPKPKPSAAPNYLPPHYPSVLLTAQTDLIICKAVKQFPVQTQVAELCKCADRQLRPHFRRAISENLLRQDMALFEMKELLRHLLIRNCDSDSLRDELTNAVMRSQEWERLAKDVVSLAAPQQLESTGKRSRNNRARIDAYIDRVRQNTGQEISRTDIWTVAGYKCRTEFQPYQSKKRCTKAARETFERVSSMDPEVFLNVKKGMKQPTR